MKRRKDTMINVIVLVSLLVMTYYIKDTAQETLYRAAEIQKQVNNLDKQIGGLVAKEKKDDDSKTTIPFFYKKR